MSTTKSSKPRDERTRNWNILVYPTKEYLDMIGTEYDGSDGYGTAPENWRDIIDEQHIQWIESPLHDKDINPDGSTKKPHWHVTLLFEGKKSFNQIKELTDKLNAPIPDKCVSVKGSVRYMAHMDNPDKAQYSKADIIGHGGADIATYLKPTSSSRYQLIKEMMDYVVEKNITEMEDLLIYASTERFDDWFPLLCDNSAYVMGAMIKSRRHRVGRAEKIINVDSKTGEIIE